MVQSDKSRAIFTKSAIITNYTGTVFMLDIKRSVELFTNVMLVERIKISLLSGVYAVAYKTINEIKNTGNNDWKKENGLLNIWLLGMFVPSHETKVIIPFVPGSRSIENITDNYFGKASADRLKIMDSVLYFTCDSKKRSKIGLGPTISKSIADSFDFKKKYP